MAPANGPYAARTHQSRDIAPQTDPPFPIKPGRPIADPAASGNGYRDARKRPERRLLVSGLDRRPSPGAMPRPGRSCPAPDLGNAVSQSAEYRPRARACSGSPVCPSCTAAQARWIRIGASHAFTRITADCPTCQTPNPARIMASTNKGRLHRGDWEFLACLPSSCAATTLISAPQSHACG